MPEQRGRQYHRERIGETLKEEISVIIEGELGDPRIALCNVTEIALAPDGKSARVFIEVAGDEREAEMTLKAIQAAKGYIRHELLVRLGVRHVPTCCLCWIVPGNTAPGSTTFWAESGSA